MTLFFFAIFSKVHSQNNNSLTNETIRSVYYNYKFEYTYQNGHYLSFGIGKLKSIFNEKLDTLSMTTAKGFSISNDFRIDFKNMDIIPKISYEHHFNFLAAKLNLGMITNFKKSSYYLSLEFGISLSGTLYVYYGYNWFEYDKFNISKHKISLGWNMYNVVEKTY